MPKQPKPKQPKLTEAQKLFGTLNKSFLVILILIWIIYFIGYISNLAKRTPYPYPIIHAQLSEYEYEKAETVPTGYVKYEVKSTDIYRGTLIIPQVAEDISANLTPFLTKPSNIYSVVLPDFLISEPALEPLNELMDCVFNITGLADYTLTNAYITPDVSTDFPDFYSGYTFAINSPTDPTNQSIIDNCANYGYILRYPPGKETVTGVPGNIQIFRYVGETAAKSMKSSGMCLEEFHANIRNYTADTEHLRIYEGVSAYYAPYNPENEYILVPVGSEFTVYGNGSDGFLILYLN